MKPDALVLVETTVPIGFCEKIVIPALASELAHDPQLLEDFRAKFIRPRRAAFSQVLTRAINDGQGTSGSDLELICDMVAGAVFYRVLISGEPISKSFAKRLTDVVLSAVWNAPNPRGRKPSF
jgi:hypothetical protein